MNDHDDVRVTAMSQLDFWLRVAGTLDASDFGQLVSNLFNLQIVLDREFERRYPEAWAIWWQAHE